MKELLFGLGFGYLGSILGFNNLSFWIIAILVFILMFVREDK